MKKNVSRKLDLKKLTVARLDEYVLMNILGGESMDCIPTEEPTQDTCGKPILW